MFEDTLILRFTAVGCWQSSAEKAAAYLRAAEASRGHGLDNIFQEQVLCDVKVQNCTLVSFPCRVFSLAARPRGDSAETVGGVFARLFSQVQSQCVDAGVSSSGAIVNEERPRCQVDLSREAVVPQAGSALFSAIGAFHNLCPIHPVPPSIGQYHNLFVTRHSRDSHLLRPRHLRLPD
jgi:hypothetical protein